MRATKRSLTTPAAVLLISLFLHDLDHVRQARSVAAAVVSVGVLGLVSAIAALTLAAVGHPLGPLAAIAVGAGNVIGFFAVHVLPRWSALSDTYLDLDVDLMSWASVGLAVTAAGFLATRGLISLRRASPL